MNELNKLKVYYFKNIKYLMSKKLDLIYMSYFLKSIEL